MGTWVHGYRVHGYMGTWVQCPNAEPPHQPQWPMQVRHSQSPLPASTASFHSQRPLPASTPSFHSQRPLPASTPSFHSQLPLPASTASFHSQRPLPASTPSFHSQLPLPASTPSFHSQRPLPASTPICRHVANRQPGLSSRGRCREGGGREGGGREGCGHSINRPDCSTAPQGRWSRHIANNWCWSLHIRLLLLSITSSRTRCRTGLPSPWLLRSGRQRTTSLAAYLQRCPWQRGCVHRDRRARARAPP